MIAVEDKITLKLDEKSFYKLSLGGWALAILVLFGACWLSYKLFTVKGPEPEATNAMMMGVGVLGVTIWVIKLAWSKTRLRNEQLRDGVILYELTPTGITNHLGETQRWSGLEKIYFKLGGVHFSYMTFNRQAAFRMDSAGINAAEFYEACEFIKTHAPKNATEKFKLDKIPRG